MRKLTRTIATLACAGTLALSVAACGGKTDDAKQTQDTTQTNGKTDDKAEDKGEAKKSDDAKGEKDAGGAANVPEGTLTEPIKNGYETGKHKATIEIEDYGTVELELDADTAPVTVSNFAQLANSKFYDGLTFHRIMRNFMIQGGDPQGTGMGGSDTNIVGEFSTNGIKNDIKHESGVISMARSMDPNSASSQFFICDGPEKNLSHLDGSYAAFGHVTKGMEIIDKIANDAKPLDDNGTIDGEKQPVILSIRVGDGTLKTGDGTTEADADGADETPELVMRAEGEEDGE